MSRTGNRDGGDADYFRPKELPLGITRNLGPAQNSKHNSESDQMPYPKANRRKEGDVTNRLADLPKQEIPKDIRDVEMTY